MAFDVNKFLEGYKPATQTGGFNVSDFLAKKYPTTTTTRGKGKLDDSSELYNLAVNKGYQKDADRILKAQSGEDTKKIFSGGFISDIFDSLNALQYGVTGVIKGKSFLEGVKTRQSFSDKDSLGDKGIPGMIGGIALDIAVDPLTYVAPWTIAKKVPMIAKAAKAIKGAIFGEGVLKPIQETAEATQKLLAASKAGKAVGITRQSLAMEGGTKLGKYMADKFVWMFGADPLYKAAYEKSIKNIAEGTQNIAKMARGLGGLTPEVSAKLLTRDETGRMARVGLDRLKKILTPDEMKLVEPAWAKIDELGKEAVDLGILSQSKFEENIGSYIKNAYTEYEQAKGKGVFGFMKTGVKGIKSRVEGLSTEKMAELGQIDNPAYLLFKSVFDLTKDVENAKLFRTTAQHLGSDIAQEGFKQLPQTRRLVTTGGIQADIMKNVGEVNAKLKPSFKALKQTFKGDKRVLSEIRRAEKTMESMSKMRAEEFIKFFQEGQKVSKKFPVSKTIRGVGKLPEHLNILGNKVKGFKTLDDVMKSDVGMELEKLYESGVLERSGFKTINDFFDFVKNPFKKVAETTRETIISNKVVKLKNLISSLKKKKSIEEVSNAIAKFAKGKELSFTKALQKITDVPRIGKNISLDLQKIGIKSIDDLIDVNKTGVFVGDDFDRFGKIRKLLGKNTEDIIENAERIVMQNDILNNVIPKLKKFKSKDKIIKYLEEQIKKASSKIELEETKNLSKLVKLQSQIEKLGRKATNLREVDKRSIDDAYRFWEETISQLTGKKEKLFEQLGDVKLGDLSGKWVPENVFNNIQNITEPAGKMVGEKIMGNFKFFKVVMNPATHARNLMSNQILNWWKLGMNPLDPRTIKSNATAIAEIAKKGGKWIDEAKTVGYNVDTFAANELRSILDSPEALGIGKKAGNAWNKIKTKLGDIYQGEENLAKLSAFIFNRQTKGMGIEDAWKAAEAATFNYAQVTPFVRKLRTAAWGFPFITFTVKSTPLAIETALKNPSRISFFGKIKQAIESQSDIEVTDRERASEPQWIKDGFYIKLPMKDKEGRSAYFDLTYIIPFGDLMAGNFFERPIQRESGMPESIPVALGSKSPLFQVIKEITRNQDFYGDKLWQDGDSSSKQLGDLMRHLTKTYLPPLVADQIPGGYKKDGTKRLKGIPGGITATPENQQRTLMEEMLRNVGAKIQPIDADIQETYQEWNKTKALKTFLEEKGELSKFEIGYIPKNKKSPKQE